MSISRESFITEVDEIYDCYQPSTDALARLNDIDLTTVSAPSGMGKDTLINSLDIPRVLADTIRKPRLNNGIIEQNGSEYIFREKELDAVIADLRKGDYVQISMGPARDSFYGSRIANYPPSGFALIDVTTSQIETMRQLPFHSIESAYIVAPSYEIWQQRLAKRGNFSSEEWQKRKNEAKRSLEDALDDERYTFILNDELSIASQSLLLLATKREWDKKVSQLARNIASTIRMRLQG